MPLPRGRVLDQIRDSTVNITCGYQIIHKLDLSQYRWKGVMSNAPPWCEGPLIDPLVKAPHRPGRGIMGDLTDKCIHNVWEGRGETT